MMRWSWRGTYFLTAIETVKDREGAIFFVLTNVLKTPRTRECAQVALYVVLERQEELKTPPPPHNLEFNIYQLHRACQSAERVSQIGTLMALFAGLNWR